MPDSEEMRPPTTIELYDLIEKLRQRQKSIERALFRVTRKDVTLAGGYECRLNLQEENQWTEFLRKLDTWQDFLRCARRIRALQLRLSCFGSVTLGNELEEAMEKQDILEEKLYVLAKAWHQELCSKLRGPAEEEGDTDG